MRIAFAFIALIASFSLWLLDVSSAVYDFRTDVREDAFVVETAAAATTANVTLLRAIFDDDTDTIGYLSTIAEIPVFGSYNTTTRQLNTTGLTANTSRTLTVNYDTNALTFSTAINNLLDWWPFIWYMILTAFPIAALVAIFTGR
jgi:hypothetical protein